MSKNPILRCSHQHELYWLITYDIGNEETESMLVCKVCYSENQSFRLYVISKDIVKESYLNQQSNNVINKLISEEGK